MGEVGIMFRRSPIFVGVVELDATLSETHSASADVTQHQVEKGADIADHVRAQPRRLALEGIITNTPLYEPGSYFGQRTGDQPGSRAFVERYKAQLAASLGLRRVLSVGGPLGLLAPDPPKLPPVDMINPHAGRAEKAWADLEQLRQSGQLVKVLTPLVVYQNMAIVDLSTTRTADSGDAIHVNIQLQEVVTVESAKAEVPPELLAKEGGRQATKKATAQQDAAAQEIRDNRSGFAQGWDEITR